MSNLSVFEQMMKGILLIGCILAAFHSSAQHEETFVTGEWYITNFTTNDFELLKADTILLRRYMWEDRKGEHVDSAFNTSCLWNMYFDESGEFDIGWVDFQAAARGGEPPFYHQMDSCQNKVWSLKRNMLTLSLADVSYQFSVERAGKSKNELLLVKMDK